MRYVFGHRRRACAVAALAMLTVAVSTLAAEPGTGRLFVRVLVSDNGIAGTPSRASVVTPDGVLVDYAEELLARAPNVQAFTLEGLAAGLYDVRVEGEGLITEVKRGVPVFAGRDETLAIVVRPGQGVRIVEYAVAGLSREEMAVRLAALETEIKVLRARLEALAPDS